MTKVLIERFETSDQGTFGRVTAGALQFFTGELPWRDNKTDFSCIPPGTYQCEWTYSPHFKRFMYLVDAGGRLGIRFHPANFMGDSSLSLRCQLNGCIALGEKFGKMDGQKAIIISAPAVRRFEKQMGKKPFQLEVLNGFSSNDVLVNP